MALVNCPGCGKKISEHATLCPSCGMSYSQTNDVTLWLVAAMNEYSQAVEIINNLSIYNKSINPNHLVDVSLKQFDCCIQDILFRIAIKNNGSINRLQKEFVFIQNIVKYGDIFKDKIVDIPLKDAVVNWKFIEEMPNNIIEPMYYIIHNKVNPVTDNFIMLSALAEQYKEKILNQTKENKSLLSKLECKISNIGEFMLKTTDGKEITTEDTIILNAAVDNIFGKCRRKYEGMELIKR